MNAPLMTQDAVRTGPGARVEIQFDSANYLRAAANSEVDFADIERGRFQAQLASGTVTLTVMGSTGAQVEVDTPSVGIHPDGPGAYRVTVSEDGVSEITVRSGLRRRSSRRKDRRRCTKARRCRCAGPPKIPSFRPRRRSASTIGTSGTSNCDQRIEHAQSAQRQYVSPDVYGTESMDGYGTWTNDPDYGSCGSLTVAPGWAPYRYGRWVWEDWYGWTWVSYDPWGWAPYHWGRWY